MSDSGNGTYAAQLRPLRAGLLTLSAVVNGELVGLPQTLAVAPGPLVTLSLAQEVPPRCTAGVLSADVPEQLVSAIQHLKSQKVHGGAFSREMRPHRR